MLCIKRGHYCAFVDINAVVYVCLVGVEWSSATKMEID